MPRRCPKYGRFPPHLMFHMDQIPLEFVMSGKKTLNPIGCKCKRVAEPGGGAYSKRQASIQLTIRAEGEQIVRPEIVFRGEGVQLTKKELDYFSSLGNIRVRFQRKAWCDEKIVLEYLEDFREQTLHLGGFMGNLDILPVWTPPDCTDCVSPIDHNVGQHIKVRMGMLYDELHDIDQEDWESGALSVSSRRMLLAGWLSKVWGELIDSDKNITLIRKSFVDTGFLVAMDGSENHLIDLDGWTGKPGTYNF
jgi:hypothetical protein